MNGESNHINYSAADIEKYWQGNLSASDMHAMEKAALDDPFLLEAMDGYRMRVNEARNEFGASSSTTVQTDLSDLAQRLAIRINTKDENRIIPMQRFGWWKVAAILVVAVAGIWIYSSINKDKTRMDIATAKRVKDETVPAPKQDSNFQPVTSDSAKDFITNELASSKKKPSTSAKKSDIPAISENEIVKAEPKDAVKAFAPVSIAKPEDLAKSEKSSSADSMIETKTTARRKDADKTVKAALSGTIKGITTESNGRKNLMEMTETDLTNLTTINGTIVNQQKEPLANTTIEIPRLKIATQTDKRGNFSFKSRDSVLNVTIAASGYETQNMKLQNNALSNQITLTPSGTVADGFYSDLKRSRASAPVKNKNVTIKIFDAEPVIDWVAYTDYLEKNKKVPEDVKDIHGNVIVSFFIDETNELKDFYIEKSLEEELDEEAIRLVKEGPAWKLLKGKKSKVSVTVKF